MKIFTTALICLLCVGCIPIMKSGLMGTAATTYNVDVTINGGRNEMLPLPIAKVAVCNCNEKDSCKVCQIGKATAAINNPYNGERVLDAAATVNVIIITNDSKDLKTQEDHSDAKNATANDKLTIPTIP